MLRHALVLLALASAPLRAERPADFRAFWAELRADLDAEPLAAELAPDAEHTTPEVACFKASYASLAGKRVHARYCRPAGPGKFPAVLVSPWYGLGAIPVPDGPARRGVAALFYQARGFEVDRASYPVESSYYVLNGLGDERAYVYREITAHGLRGLDFLASRPEVDAKRLAVMGASQGGGLSLLIAGLDRRVSLAAADFPFLCDWPRSLEAPDPPYAEVRAAIDKDTSTKEGVLRSLAYFDALSAAPDVTAPTLVQAGLKDRTCPAAGIEAVYAKLRSRRKRLREWDDAGHADRNAERWKAMEDWVVAGLVGQRPDK